VKTRFQILLSKWVNLCRYSKDQVIMFCEQDCKRILNDLIADGTITRAEAEAAERDRSARKLKRALDDRDAAAGGAAARKRQRRIRGGGRGKGAGAGAKRARRAGAGAAGEGKEEEGGGGAEFEAGNNEDLEAERAEIGKKLSKESTHTAAYRRMQAGASGAPPDAAAADADAEAAFAAAVADDDDEAGLYKLNSGCTS
jgi:hypothetical protein